MYKFLSFKNKYRYMSKHARGVIAIVVGNGHDNTSSNPGRD